MENISLLRIDDRLIHGQVMTAWVKHTNANRIIIVDDEVVKDSFLIKVLKMAAPSGIKVEVFSIEEATEYLKQDMTDDNRIIVLVKVPQTIEELLNEGIEFKKVILGGMGSKPGRKKLYRNISVSKEEKDSFRNILNNGVEVEIQIVPDDKVIQVLNLL